VFPTKTSSQPSNLGCSTMKKEDMKKEETDIFFEGKFPFWGYG